MTFNFLEVQFPVWSKKTKNRLKVCLISLETNVQKLNRLVAPVGQKSANQVTSDKMVNVLLQVAAVLSIPDTGPIHTGHARDVTAAIHWTIKAFTTMLATKLVSGTITAE